MNGDVEEARVRADAGGEDHPTLFPLAEIAAPRRAPQEVCRGIGLNWLAAVELFEKGWLSFDPGEVSKLSPPQAAELSFLGALIAAGCDRNLLGQLLAGLRKPYAYRMDRLYYDWPTRAWRLLPGRRRLEERFEHWLDALVDGGEVEKLEAVRASVERALRELSRLAPW